MLVRHHITSSLGQHKLELKGSQLLKKWVEGGGAVERILVEFAAHQ